MDSNFYQAFEERFRGSRSLIKNRLEVYLPFLQPLRAMYPEAPVIDLGCGRGEWLELLKEEDILAIGVDLDDSALAICQEMKLAVEKASLLDYIRRAPDESLLLVSGFHVAEHLPFADLMALVQEALRALKPGGLLILEVPNPENIIVGTVNFYLDPSHLRCIPPELLAFLPEYAGFARINTVRLQEPPELSVKSNINLYDVFSGVSPDYAIVAQKTASPEFMAEFDDVFNQERGLRLEALATRYHARMEELSAKLETIQKNQEVIFQRLDQIQAEQNSRANAEWARKNIPISLRFKLFGKWVVDKLNYFPPTARIKRKIKKQFPWMWLRMKAVSNFITTLSVNSFEPETSTLDEDYEHYMKLFMTHVHDDNGRHTSGTDL